MMEMKIAKAALWVCAAMAEIVLFGMTAIFAKATANFLALPAPCGFVGDAQ